MNEMMAALAGRRPKTLAPFLAGAFIIAWGLLIVLVVMQDRMIDAQGELIHSFVKESAPRVGAPASIERRRILAKVPQSESSKAIGSVSTGHRAANDPEIQGKNSVADSVSQVPLSQKALSQSPSSQVKAKPTDKTGRSVRKGRSPFSPPPAEITDPSDQRRGLVTI